MNDQQLSQIEQRIERNEILLDHPPSDTLQYNAARHAALLQANDDIRTLICEVKMTETTSIRINLDKDLHRRVRFKALTQNTTVAAVVREKLRDWVENEKPIVLPPKTQPTGKITG